MKKLLLLSALFIFGCSNTPEKNIFVWNYSTNYDELDEKTIFKSKVYSTTQTNFDWPYGDARYFLEIKTIIPDNIKTFDDYLYYSSRTQTNLINIKCSECPSYAYGRNSLKYKIDKKKPGAYTGYTAVRDNDELDKYSFLSCCQSAKADTVTPMLTQLLARQLGLIYGCRLRRWAPKKPRKVILNSKRPNDLLA